MTSAEVKVQNFGKAVADTLVSYFSINSGWLSTLQLA
jgi:hypothetical protein